MRYRFSSFLFSSFVFILLIVPDKALFADSTNIIISEVSVTGEESNDEFIELYNQDNEPVHLSGIQLRRRTTSGSESSIKVFSKDSVIPGNGFFLWAHSDGIYALPFADTETSSSSLAPDNSIGLFTQSGKDGILLDSVAWGKGALFSPDTPILPNPGKNKSLVRDTTLLVWSTGNMTPTNSRGDVFLSSIPIPDPTPAPSPLPLPSSVAVRFNEIFSNPKGDETEGEFIELYNADTKGADIGGFTIRDASKTGSYVFPSNTLIEGNGYLVLKRSLSKLSLNNTNETLSFLDTTGASIDSAQYEKTKEGVSLNFTESGWRGGTPTPGAANSLNILPETKEKVPKKGYRGMTTLFDARGKDQDGDSLKYTWDFGDGHKSYKKETAHKYEENGTYQVSLTTTDGSDDVIENFSIKIGSFPKPDVRITALIPNPSGKDTDSEWLTIENHDKKPIDLKGFGIATGWKNLVNHPVRESFVIAPKSSAKLTREFSLFTLPNEKGKIEFRAPDGKVLQDIKYKLDKSAAEDAVYFKEKGKRWAWREETKNVEQKSMVSNEVVTTLEEIPIIPVDNTPLKVIPTEESLDRQILGAVTVKKDVADQAYVKLLNYGTGVTLPDDIVLSFPESALQPAVKKEHYAVTFAKELFTDLNAALNALQEEDWEGQPL